MSETFNTMPELIARANAEIDQGWDSKARVESARVLYAQGYSASQIAAKIGGVTRNAVIGIIYRKKMNVNRDCRPRSTKPRLKRQKAPAQPVQPRRPASAKVFDRFQGEAEPYTPTAEIAVPPEQRKTMATLRDHHCKWPYNDPKHGDFYFCGGERAAGLPYCEGHSRIAYRPPEPRASNKQSIAATQRGAGAQNASSGGGGSQKHTTPSSTLVEAK